MDSPPYRVTFLLPTRQYLDCIDCVVAQEALEIGMV